MVLLMIVDDMLYNKNAAKFVHSFNQHYRQEKVSILFIEEVVLFTIWKYHLQDDI
jgi:hypothetical protein